MITVIVRHFLRLLVRTISPEKKLIPMTGVISGVVTPKDKTKSNPLARLKVRIFTKSVVSF